MGRAQGNGSTAQGRAQAVQPPINGRQVFRQRRSRQFLINVDGAAQISLFGQNLCHGTGTQRTFSLGRLFRVGCGFRRNAAFLLLRSIPAGTAPEIVKLTRGLTQRGQLHIFPGRLTGSVDGKFIRRDSVSRCSRHRRRNFN